MRVEEHIFCIRFPDITGYGDIGPERFEDYIFVGYHYIVPVLFEEYIFGILSMLISALLRRLHLPEHHAVYVPYIYAASSYWSTCALQGVYWSTASLPPSGYQ